jgi:hypothetical protein
MSTSLPHRIPSVEYDDDDWRKLEIFIEFSQIPPNFTHVRKAQNQADWKEQMVLIGSQSNWQPGPNEIEEALRSRSTKTETTLTTRRHRSGLKPI